jgi:hypothetical protein
VQEVDPCEDLTDADIQTIIQNATGPRTPLFVPEVGLLFSLSENKMFPFLLLVDSLFVFLLLLLKEVLFLSKAV